MSASTNKKRHGGISSRDVLVGDVERSVPNRIGLHHQNAISLGEAMP